MMESSASMPLQKSFESFLIDTAATEALGGRLAAHFQGGMVIALSGDLGAGKTTLVRGMLRALGISGPVKSPSYALVEEYLFSRLRFKMNLYHFDFYRIKDKSEWDSGGFSEYFRDDAVCVIEWPEKLGDRLPPVDLVVSLTLPADVSVAGRQVRIVPYTKAGEECLTAMMNS
ncbi:MAG: tRNA (adenosine(37)-N6)-threonylcarbamoyltransferase complex ATPase subunit type 1 TsaE [Proteobacteria bacterium]|nr:tRNA (adenosine(37)-N6)-threonylcarbamoyltransferase complex ATPase subunit type 1 TsaE [Pseudomonadota bacterium]